MDPIFSRLGLAARRKLLRLAKKSRFLSREIFFLYFEESRPVRNMLGYERLASLKDTHEGLPGFVVGNGPSLSKSQLQRLSGQIWLGANFISLARKSFRSPSLPLPSYWSVADTLVWSKMGVSEQEKFSEVFLSGHLDPRRATVPANVIRPLGTADGSVQTFSTNLCAGFYLGSSVSYLNLQLAAHLGLSPIYLLGMDHRYDEPPGSSRLIRVRKEINHFDSTYRKPGEIVMRSNAAAMNLAFQSAAAWSKQSGVPIVNLTPDSNLDVFPKGVIEDVLK